MFMYMNIYVYAYTYFNMHMVYLHLCTGWAKTAEALEEQGAAGCLQFPRRCVENSQEVCIRVRVHVCV